MNTYTPPYKPRQGTNMEAACSAIEEAGQLSCEPLAKILSCQARDVPAYLQGPLKRGYIQRVHVAGVLHFERVRVEGEKVLPPIPPAPRPLAASSPFAQGDAVAAAIEDELTAFNKGYQAHEAGEGLPAVKTDPEFARGWFARQREGRGAVGTIKYLEEEASMGKSETIFGERLKAVAGETEPSGAAFSVGFNTSSEFGMNLGGTQHALTREQAKLLYRVLHSMHLAELL